MKSLENSFSFCLMRPRCHGFRFVVFHMVGWFTEHKSFQKKDKCVLNKQDRFEVLIRLSCGYMSVCINPVGVSDLFMWIYDLLFTVTVSCVFCVICMSSAVSTERLLVQNFVICFKQMVSLMSYTCKTIMWGHCLCFVSVAVTSCWIFCG